MRKSLQLPLWLAAVLSAAFLVACQSPKPTPAAFADIAPDETIHVELDVGSGMDAYAYFSDAVEEAFETAGISNPIDVSRWPGKDHPDGVVLVIQVLNWGTTTGGLELETRFEATLWRGRESVNLGIFRNTGVPFPGEGFHDLQIEAYQNAARGAVSKMIADLLPYLEG